MTKIYYMFFTLFLSVPAVANFITQNAINACNADNLVSADNKTFMFAMWQLNSYTCAPGYYLPANAVECAECPVDHTCSGGTYVFNEYKNQGLILNFVISHNLPNGCANDILLDNANMAAIWQRNSYDCDAGYYLPADGIECELCPADNYCPGGKYEYSETVPQGIMECPDGLYSAVGMGNIASCGRKFHIGDSVLFTRSAKQTVPSLNFDFDGDGVADFFLNLTTIRTHMNGDSPHYLHVGDYYIYDDTVSPGE